MAEKYTIKYYKTGEETATTAQRIDTSKFKIRKVKEGINRVRYSGASTLKFFATDYDNFIAELLAFNYELVAEIWKDNSLYFTGKISLVEGNFNHKNKTCELKFSFTDNYKEFLDNYDKDKQFSPTESCSFADEQNIPIYWFRHGAASDDVFQFYDVATALSLGLLSPAPWSPDTTYRARTLIDFVELHDDILDGINWDSEDVILSKLYVYHNNKYWKSLAISTNVEPGTDIYKWQDVTSEMKIGFAIAGQLKYIFTDDTVKSKSLEFYTKYEPYWIESDYKLYFVTRSLESLTNNYTLKGNNIVTLINQLMPTLTKPITMPANGLLWYWEGNKKLFLSPKYIIKAWGGTPSTISNTLNLKRLLEILKLQLGLDWYLEDLGTSQNFYLIDKDYYTLSAGGIDFRSVAGKNFSAGLSIFEFPEERVYIEKWKNEVGHAEFAEKKVQYTEIGTNQVDYNLPEINNDIVSIINNIGDIQDTGWCILLNDSSNYIDLSYYVPNGYMQYSELLKYNLNVGRPYAKDLDGNLYTNTLPDKTHQEIKIPASDIRTIDLDKYCQTDLTTAGEIYEVEESLNGTFLTFKIKFDAIR